MGRKAFYVRIFPLIFWACLCGESFAAEPATAPMCSEGFTDKFEVQNQEIAALRTGIMDWARGLAKKSWNPFRWPRIKAFFSPPYPLAKKIISCLDDMTSQGFYALHLRQALQHLSQTNERYLNSSERLALRTYLMAAERRIQDIQTAYDIAFPHSLSEAKIDSHLLNRAIDHYYRINQDKLNYEITDETLLAAGKIVDHARERNGAPSRPFSEYTDAELQLAYLREERAVSQSTDEHEKWLGRALIQPYTVVYRWMVEKRIQVAAPEQYETAGAPDGLATEDLIQQPEVEDDDRYLNYRQIFMRSYDTLPRQPLPTNDPDTRVLPDTLETVRTDGLFQLITQAKEIASTEGFLYRTLVTHQTKLRALISSYPSQFAPQDLEVTIKAFQFLLAEVHIYQKKTPVEVKEQFDEDDYEFFLERCLTFADRVEHLLKLARIFEDLNQRKVAPLYLRPNIDHQPGPLSILKKQMKADAAAKTYLLIGAAISAPIIGCLGWCSMNQPPPRSTVVNQTGYENRIEVQTDSFNASDFFGIR